MSKVPVDKNSSNSLTVNNSSSDILRFDLCPDAEEDYGSKNTTKIPDNAIRIYPPADLENNPPDFTKFNNFDVLEELEKLENLRDKKLLMFSCDDAELYFIEPNGDVKSTFEKNELIIFKLDGDPAEIIFLEVGDWIYPLTSEVKPCYKSNEGIFVFPDIYSEVENASVGLIIPKNNCEALHEVLCDIFDDKEHSPRTRRSTATDAPGSVSQSMYSKTNYLAQNMIRASKSLASGIDSATSNAISKIQPQASKSVDPALQSTVHSFVTVTGCAAGVTGYLSSSLGHAVVALGRYISPHISKKLKETVPSGAVDVIYGTLQGAANIYNGLEESAEILAHSMSNNAVKLVGHRYGQPVGEVTSDVLATVKNIYLARRNANMLRPKTIAKGMLKSAGYAMLEDREKFS